MELTKEEVRQYLRMALQGKEVSVFIQKEKGDNIYVRLEMIEYMQTILTGMPIFVERQQGTEKPAEEPARAAGEERSGLHRDSAGDEKTPKTQQNIEKPNETAEKPKKPARLRVEKCERKPKPDFANENGDDLGELIQLAKAGRTAEWIADDMGMTIDDVKNEIRIICDMLKYRKHGRNVEWIAATLQLPIERVREEIDRLENKR